MKYISIEARGTPLNHMGFRWLRIKLKWKYFIESDFPYCDYSEQNSMGRRASFRGQQAREPTVGFSSALCRSQIEMLDARLLFMTLEELPLKEYQFSSGAESQFRGSSSFFQAIVADGYVYFGPLLKRDGNKIHSLSVHRPNRVVVRVCVCVMSEA